MNEAMNEREKNPANLAPYHKSCTPHKNTLSSTT